MASSRDPCSEKKLKISVPIIWLIGGPGAGKKTQSEKIACKFNYKSLNVGDLIRQEIKSGSTKGKEYDKNMKAGKPVSNEDAIGLLKKAIKKSVECSCGIVIVDFPPDKEQGEAFAKEIAPVDLIILLDCPDETLLKRSKERAERLPENCRPDDEALKTRIAVFKEKSRTIVEFYKDKAKNIRGDRKIDEVFCSVVSAIDCHMTKACCKNDDDDDDDDDDTSSSSSNNCG